MADWTIARLAKGQDRGAFDCGETSLDDWLKRKASQSERKGLACTYVAMRPGQARVLGYYAIANHHVRYEALAEDQAKGLPPRIAVPVVLLARLATDRSVRGRGLGKVLLIDALGRALYLAEHIGIHAVEVDAINEAARSFYLHFGFRPLPDDRLHLYYPLTAARNAGLRPIAP